ncbi:MAG TPA: hypothetical protein EYP07_13745 [Kiloniellaceae bacterium]|nr:hypothetical protein [Kiloniellaceae bacterium]
MVGQTGERWYEAELHRIRGELLLSAARPEPARAEPEFRRALDLADAQGARLWGLRAAVSLAELYLDHGDAAAARDVLEPLHAWFEATPAAAEGGQRRDYHQGEDSVEYRRAARILKELTATARP